MWLWCYWPQVRDLRDPHSPKGSQAVFAMAGNVRGTLAFHVACEEDHGDKIPQRPSNEPAALLGHMPDGKVMPQELLQLNKSRPAVMTNTFGRTQP